MKLLYTRKEVDDMISQRDREQFEMHRLEDIERHIWRVEDRITLLENKLNPGPETPSCCSTMKGS